MSSSNSDNQNEFSSDDSIIIKSSELFDVMKDTHDHIANLLKRCANLSNKEQDYPLVIVLAIIATEEIGKFAFFGDYRRRMKDIPKSRMKKILDHRFKLKYILERERERENLQNNRSENSLSLFNQGAEYQKEVSLKLNTIKELVLYTNYAKGKIITLDSLFMQNDITKNNLAHFAGVLFELTQYLFHLETLRMQCGDIEGYIYPEKEEVKNNKNYKRIAEFAEKTRSDEYSSRLKKFQSTMLELEKLVEYIDIKMKNYG